MPENLKHFMCRNVNVHHVGRIPLRQHLPSSTPSNPSPTSSKTRSPSPSTNTEEFSQQSDKFHRGQLASASPSANSPTTSAVVVPLPFVIQQQSKPKSVKHRKSRSHSPLPVVHHTQTIRLDIKLGSQDNYEVDVTALALRDIGQRAPTLTVPLDEPAGSSDSEKDSDDHAPSKTPDKEKKGKRRPRGAEYDLTDPFIDNSDLGIDDRTHFPQTKQKGFYISCGEVELLVPEKSPRKPRSAAKPFIQPLSQTVSQSCTPTTEVSECTADFPILLDDSDEEEGSKRSLKRDRPSSPSITVADAHDSETDQKRSKKARRSASTDASNSSSPSPQNATSYRFSDSLEASFDELKIEAAKEKWEVKGRFPLSLNLKLRILATDAIWNGEYNEHFFARMPLIFPYNEYTMTKLIKRFVYDDHYGLLKYRRDELLDKLKVLADKGFEQAETEWEKNVRNWKKRVAKDSTVSKNNAYDQPDDTTDDHDDQEKEGPGGSGGWSGKETKEKEPQKKYRLTEEMKTIFWKLYCQAEYEEGVISGGNGLNDIEFGMIVAAFPKGWMTSGNISRDSTLPQPASLVVNWLLFRTELLV
ncbi:hypothetical protein Clacol_003351 [Clathrus columnatus]|uniref:Ubinuclein middle domain-containing protein n=1 Tax=Clathrus columnatus TaxID=1419009 RepID=A0AAV5A8R2_9AGAM|nr:hypothetical protein Clacol_003351 [Clathrus columnatus]